MTVWEVTMVVVSMHIICAGVSILREDLVYIDALTAPLVAIVGLYKVLWDQRHFIIPLVYILWGLRLGGFIVYRRWLLGKKDAKCITTDVISVAFFSGVRLAWGMSMIATLYVVPHRSEVVRLELAVMAIVCILVQHLADCQITLWRWTNKRDQYREGLFQYSRSPNLVAELGFHFFTGLAVSPHSILGLLAFVTSIALITLVPSNTLHTRNIRAHERWGHQSSFQTYTETTPLLMTLSTPYKLIKASTVTLWRLQFGMHPELRDLCTFSSVPRIEPLEQTLPLSVRIENPK